MVFSLIGCETKNPTDEGNYTLDTTNSIPRNADEGIKGSMRCQAGKYQTGKCQGGKQ